MSKLLLLILAAVVFYLWFKHSRRSPSGDAGSGKEQTPSGPEQMVQCAHCGVHLPESESVTADGGARFCGEEHRALGPR